ncbi:MAG: response regulator [Rhodanobacteraceae bacterium]
MKDTLRIVYAEDDELVRATVTEMLTALGADVRTCANGAEAVLLCLSTRPNVALLDLTMPGMDGFDGATRIQQNSERIYLVALTGHTHATSMKQARTAGFDEVLTKPITLDVLEGAVMRWSEMSRAT